jgi:AraC-like DNA-binding protein
MLNASARARLPLPRHPCLDVLSLDEASDIYSRMAAPVHIHGLPGKEPFLWRVHHLALGPLALVASETTSSVWAECEGASDAYLLSLPLGRESAESTIGKAVMPVVLGRSGMLCGPWQHSKVVVRSGFRGLQIAIPRKAVIAAVTTLTGSESREIQFQARIALDSLQVEPFMRLISSVLREAEEEQPAFTRPGASECLAEALLFRFLLSQPNSQSTLFSAASRSAEPRHVRRAAEYIDTHFEQPITIAELTRVTGVSARSLQLGFQKHRGCSPLDFVRARRLERARVLLLTSDSVETVSEVAQLTGVGHLGRFSIRYRMRFGESPTHTLARRWGRTG